MRLEYTGPDVQAIEQLSINGTKSHVENHHNGIAKIKLPMLFNLI